MISEAVSRYDGRHLRSSLRLLWVSKLSLVECLVGPMLLTGVLARIGTVKRGMEVDFACPWRRGVGGDGILRADIDLTGLIENKPISPVSVVVLNILSSGPGDGKIRACPLGLRRGLEKA